MRVLVVHNSYQHRGGEDAVLEAEIKIMVTNGNQVFFEKKENDSINSVLSKIKAFSNVAYSKKSKIWMLQAISKYNPDIVHIHNIFPQLSPSIYDACLDARIPVVQTLHNYRLMCPGALLMRKGRICQKCVLGSTYQSVLYGCYRDSKVGTFAVARMVSYHRKNNTWNTKVDRFIALTKFAKNKFVEAGFPEHKISVKPNFVDDLISENKALCREEKALFVGRISQEKGVDVMLSAWNRVQYPIAIAGDGPSLINLKSECKDSNVCFLGNQSKKQIHKLMSAARFLVMPSVWYEGFPMVLVEAFAHGLPVICSCLGGMAEIIEDGVTGLHFEPGDADDLAKKVHWMIAHPKECEQIGKNARLEYEQKYTPEKNYEMLIDIYQQAIDSNSRVNRKL